MAKKEVAKSEKSEVEVFDEDFMNQVDGMSDLGYSQKSEDGVMPLVTIIQPLSQELQKKGPRFIEGASEGDIIIRATGQRWKADREDGGEGIVFQQCAWRHVYVEWEGEPGDSVPVGTYDYDSRPPGSKMVEGDDGRKWLEMENGNRLVEVRQHFVHLMTDDGPLACVIPFSGTNHQVSRRLTSMMRAIRLPNGKRAPAFTRLFELTTVHRSRGSQNWYCYDVKDMGWVKDRELLNLGLEFFRAEQEDRVRAADMEDENPVKEAQSEEGADKSDDVPF